jgi:(4-(4-[2-(gamma-L-glutamylamino)ethyl]phenoxymethyl)furan-2-yl)methanamine synthase
MTLTAGYDIGGAHLKVALVEDGRVILARQILCPLWRGIEHLDAALAEAKALTSGGALHAVTMTGELADVFPDRYTGVARIIERTVAALGPGVRIWMGRRGFGTPAEAEEHWADTASANYLATSTLTARLAGTGILIDMGSTTTDIIPFRDGKVIARGYTDGERLRTGELVYTGLTRTPVAMVTQRGLFKGEWQGLAREAFATMADVRRVLGTLPDEADQHTTSDGRGKSAEESRARLARMFGRDAEPGEDADWTTAAGDILNEQWRSIEDGIGQVLAAAAAAQPCIVSAGIGWVESEVLARRITNNARSFGAMLAVPGELHNAATWYAPAVAVALLAEVK